MYMERVVRNPTMAAKAMEAFAARDVNGDGTLSLDEHLDDCLNQCPAFESFVGMLRVDCLFLRVLRVHSFERSWKFTCKRLYATAKVPLSIYRGIN